MADYRLSHLDLSIRIDLAMQMLNPLRAWGVRPRGLDVLAE
jgi:hypothetical protein